VNRPILFGLIILVGLLVAGCVQQTDQTPTQKEDIVKEDVVKPDDKSPQTENFISDLKKMKNSFNEIQESLSK